MTWLAALSPNLVRGLRAVFAWQTIRDTGCWLYQQNSVTGGRRIRRSQPGGHQPIDASWMSGRT